MIVINLKNQYFFYLFFLKKIPQSFTGIVPVLMPQTQLH